MNRKTSKRTAGRRLAPVTLFGRAPRELHPALSQPRACLLLISEIYADDPQTVALCKSGMETLTELIGDGFRPNEKL